MQRVEIGTHRYGGQEYKIVYYSRGGSKSPKSVYLEGPKRITPKQIRLLGISVFNFNTLFRMQFQERFGKAYPAANALMRVLKRDGYNAKPD